MNYLAVRGLDEAVFVDNAIGSQRAYKTNVRAFRRLYGANAAIVGKVDIPYLKSGAV
jgi:hypothetical protein